MIIGFEAKRFFHNATGLGNYSRDLVGILRKFYPDNLYYLYNPKKVANARFLPDGKIIIEKKPERFLHKMFPTLWRSKWIIKDLLKDAVQIYHGLSGELPFGIEKSGIKTIVTIHDLIFIRYPKYYHFIDRLIYKKKFKYAAQKADLVVAISEQTKQDIITYLGIQPKKIKVIYQGCHPVFKENITPEYQSEVLNKFKIPEKYLLYVGSIIERKRLLTAIKAVAITNDYLVVVGKGDAYFKVVQDYIMEHRLEGKIIFLQGVNMKELAVLYRKATIFLHPSIFEGFGIPIIEALYSGVPVIAATGSCFMEAGGPNSAYIDLENSKEFVNKIEQIKQDEPLRQKMIEYGKSYAQNFNDEVIAAQWESAYQSLL